MSPAVLVQAGPIRLERVQISNAPVHPVERTLELRGSVRVTPSIDLELGIASPDSLGTQCQPLTVPVMSAQPPAEAALWMASHNDFTSVMISLGNVANFQLSTTGFEDLRDGREEELKVLAGARGSVASPAETGAQLEEIKPLVKLAAEWAAVNG